ncbi:MAG: NAD(P)H-hydrate dehydratase [Clostridia bacterium]|nr:NAD(P)H-hydrate dehydratase [Clostridia bacterium]NCC43636.1 NAD(P)H-hydrate dehydratase [Clostridia bacterium]
MKKIVTGLQMKALDQYTISDMGVPSLVLMERAALAAVCELEKGFDLSHVLVICGSGNNGADGIAMARILSLRGIKIDIYMAGKMESFTEETRVQWKIAENYGVVHVNNFEPDEYTTIVDAVFGVGLSRDITGKYVELIERINNSKAPVLSVDIPSGIDAASGQVRGIAVKAAKTVTFAYGKAGLYLYPGAFYAGDVIVKDIGIYEQKESEENEIYALEIKDMERLPKRTQDGNKGTFGKVLIIAGSHNMSGAAYFSAKACLLGGAGMVMIFTEESNRIILQQQFPEAMLTTYRKEEDRQAVLTALEGACRWSDVQVAGPGLGKSEISYWIIEHLLKTPSDKPLILDADGINIVSEDVNMLVKGKRLCILTPHMGEMSRLSGIGIEELKADPITRLKDFREKCPENITIVMKDARTLTACSGSNKRFYLNLTGNSGMATAGSGDTLTGIIASLLAQGLDQDEAAAMGVWLHGLAGDLAKKKKGERSMMASDILEAIPEAFMETIGGSYDDKEAR